MGFGYLNLIIFTILFKLGNVDVAVFMRMNLGIVCIVWGTCAFGVFISHLIKNMGVSIIISILLIATSNFFASFLKMLVKNESYIIYESNEEFMNIIYGFSGMRNVITDFSSTPQEVITCSLILILLSIIMVILTSVIFTKRDIE